MIHSSSARAWTRFGAESAHDQRERGKWRGGVDRAGEATRACSRSYETLHALNLGGELTSAEREAVVEGAAYVICGMLGLDTAASSFPYVASWGGNDGPARVSAAASAIDAIGRRIEDALLTPDAPANDQSAVSA